jgi:hypothetical protein
MSNENGTVKLSEGRLSKLESEVDHIGKDVSEIKSELSDRRDTDINVAESLARLTLIAEQNQKLEPKIEALGVRIASNEKFIWKAAGAITLGAFLGSILLSWGLRFIQ